MSRWERSNAKMQRRKDAKTKGSSFVFLTQSLCAFASLRLCVDFLGRSSVHDDVETIDSVFAFSSDLALLALAIPQY